MILYRIGGNGYFDGTMEWPDDPEEINGIPYGTTKTATPEIPEGSYAVWSGSGWYLIQTPPPIEEIMEEVNVDDQGINIDPNV